MDLTGKVAIVTGAATGIGQQIVKELLKNGIQGVSIFDTNANVAKAVVANLEKEFGRGRAIFLKTDVTNMEEMGDAFKETIRTFGCLDIVVNNAGIANDIDYELEIDINLTGVVRGTILGLKYMGKDQGGKGGVIVNISSQTAFTREQLYPIYAATKAGILNLSRGFGHASHYTRTGVKVLSICPARTDTSVVANLKVIAGNADEFRQTINAAKSQPPEAVAQAVLYAIQNGESASVWMIIESKLFRLDMPDWTSFSEYITTFNKE